MEFSQQTQAELERRHEHFLKLESQARAQEVAPAAALVVIRADGIKSSKRFLKNSLECPEYHNALHKAVGSTHRLWHAWAPPQFRPYLLGALRISDEVSFVVNRGDNYFGRRLLKITTTIASTLSGAMSLAFASFGHQGSLANAPVVAFDGRPLVVHEIAELQSYIRWRRLLQARNAMARTLRLKSSLSDDELYRSVPRLADDIHRLGLEVDARRLWPAFQSASSGGALYIATADGGLDGETLPADPDDERPVLRTLSKWSSLSETA